MPEEVDEQGSLSRSSLESGTVEQDVVFSTSLETAYQGRPQDDWTLEAQHSSLIIGGQVKQLALNDVHSKVARLSACSSHQMTKMSHLFISM